VCEEIRKTGANVYNEGNDEDGSEEEENVFKMARKVYEAAHFVFVQLIGTPPRLCYAEQNSFSLGKNFSRDEGVWLQVKFFRNNISASVQIVSEERMNPMFYFSKYCI
jgi:hypothetical protein